MTATTSTTDPASTDPGPAIEALAGRLFSSAVGAIELLNIHLGKTLGLYQHLADAGPLTSPALSARAGLDERYVREWLQAQAVSGLLTFDGPDVTTAAFALPAAAAEVLLNEVSPAYLAPLGDLLVGAGAVIPALIDAFRTGDGVAYSAYPGGVSAQAALNRPGYTNDLVSQWLPAVPDISARLADPGARVRVADLGCGAGWAAIALAEAFPHVRIDGLDADDESITLARANAASHGVAQRVMFAVRDLSEPDDSGVRYDLGLLFECLHDFAYPDRVLAQVRAQLAAGGSVIVMDEATDDELAATEDPVQRLFANISPLWCLPQGRFGAENRPVGTVLRTSRLRELAEEAGFSQVSVLPIEHPFFRFYRLDA